MKDRGAWLRTLAVSGFATAFEALVEHERVGWEISDPDDMTVTVKLDKLRMDNEGMPRNTRTEIWHRIVTSKLPH